MSLRSRHWWFGLGITLVVICAVGFAWWFLFMRGRPYTPSPLSFDGTSDQLSQTVIVPTLDSPIPEGKSVIWCASFQLAWNRLKDDVVKEPIQLANAQAIADRLNKADQSDNDVGPEAVYSAAGLVRDGIVERIQAQMASKFPNVPKLELDRPKGGVVAYAYLAASAKYDYPFFENDERFLFKDSAGKETAVGSFGIRKKDDYAYQQLRQQVQVLFHPREALSKGEEIPEFIVDLCKSSQPYQVVVARVDRNATLAKTLADVEQKIASQPADSFMSQLHPRDVLLVPSMAWKISHRFKELEGMDKQFLNPALQKLYLDTALQTIQFRLDRSGAELWSEAKVYVKPSARFFHVNRPFLVYMKKRGGQHPFFVAWVENAELLEKK
jgi:hypothetical protein